MTTNIQLEAYVKRHPLPNAVFLGCFASDQLPDTNVKNACLIINYSPDADAGTHWVAMRRLNTAMPEYFDSFGLSPDKADPILSLNTDFTDYLKQHSTFRGAGGADSTTGSFAYNTFDLQSWNKGQTVCGEFALAFLYNGIPKLSTPFWVRYLKEPNGVKRDEMIRRYIGIVRQNNS